MDRTRVESLCNRVSQNNRGCMVCDSATQQQQMQFWSSTFEGTSHSSSGRCAPPPFSECGNAVRMQPGTTHDFSSIHRGAV